MNADNQDAMPPTRPDNPVGHVDRPQLSCYRTPRMLRTNTDPSRQTQHATAYNVT